MITVLKFILSRRRLSSISPFCTAPPSLRVMFRDFGMKGFHRCHPSKSTRTAHTSFGLAWMSTANGPAEYLKQLMFSFAGGGFGECCLGVCQTILYRVSASTRSLEECHKNDATFTGSSEQPGTWS